MDRGINSKEVYSKCRKIRGRELLPTWKTHHSKRRQGTSYRYCWPCALLNHAGPGIDFNYFVSCPICMPSLNCTSCRTMNVSRHLSRSGPNAQQLRDDLWQDLLGLCNACISTKYRLETVSCADFIQRLERSALSYTILTTDTPLHYQNRYLRPDLLIMIEIEEAGCKLVVDTEWDERMHGQNTVEVEGYYERTKE